MDFFLLYRKIKLCEDWSRHESNNNKIPPAQFSMSWSHHQHLGIFIKKARTCKYRLFILLAVTEKEMNRCCLLIVITFMLFTHKQNLPEYERKKINLGNNCGPFPLWNWKKNFISSCSCFVIEESRKNISMEEIHPSQDQLLLDWFFH